MDRIRIWIRNTVPDIRKSQNPQSKLVNFENDIPYTVCKSQLSSYFIFEKVKEQKDLALPFYENHLKIYTIIS